MATYVTKLVSFVLIIVKICSLKHKSISILGENISLIADYEDVDVYLNVLHRVESKNTIKTKAEEFAGLLGHKDFKVSNVWLDDFKYAIIYKVAQK